jgi:hypothetical protein
MPIAQFQTPDGKIAEFEVPEGTTEQQMHDFANSELFHQATQQPKEQSAFDSFANAGVAAIANRGVGAMQLAEQAGVPVHKAFGLTPDEFNAATQKAVQNNNESTKGSGVIGAVTGALADPINLVPVGKLGKLALPAYGALSGVTQGLENNSVGNRVGETALQTVAAPVIGKSAEFVGSKVVAPVAGKVAEYTPDVVKKAVTNGAQYVADKLNPTVVGDVAQSVIQKTPSKAEQLYQNALQKFNAAKQSKAEIIPPETLQSNYDALSKEATDRGLKYNPQYNNDIINKIDSLYPDTSVGVPTAAQNKLADILDKYKADYAANNGKTLQDANVVLKQLDSHIASLPFGSPEAGALKALRTTIKDTSIVNPNKYIQVGDKSAADALSYANQNYSAKKKMETLQKILENSYTKDNPETAIRTGISTLLRSKEMKFWSPEERKMLEIAQQRGNLGEIIKSYGGRLTGGLMGGAAGFTGGGALGGIAGEMTGNFVGGKLADKSGQLQADRVNALIKALQKDIKTAKDLPPFSMGNQVQGPNKPMLALPAPSEKPMYVSATGTVSPETSTQNFANMGLTPDVRAVQSLNNAKELLNSYGKSDIVEEINKTGVIPFDKIARMPIQQAQTIFNTLKPLIKVKP